MTVCVCERKSERGKESQLLCVFVREAEKDGTTKEETYPDRRIERG